jgi:hypothetical protein
MPSSSKHLAINIGRYSFYDESPNEYSFTNEDLGLSTNESDFDMYDFYYNVEELKTPPKMDDDTISNLQSPTLQRWSSFLLIGPNQKNPELDCTIHNIAMIMGRN